MSAITVSGIYVDATRAKRGKTARYCFNTIITTPEGRAGQIHRFEDREDAEAKRSTYLQEKS